MSLLNRIRIMRVAYAGIVLFLVFFAMQISAASRCKHDEVEYYSNDFARGYVCQKCTVCPPGEGPSKHCGAEYINGTIITCKPCIDGKTFSEEESISSCQPCPLCGGRETLQSCTRTRKSICSNKCRLGFFMDHVVDDCVPDPLFKTTSQQPNNIAKQTTTEMTETMTIPSTTDSTTTTQVQETQRETHEKPSTRHFHPTADNLGKNGQPNNKNPDHSKDNKIILVVICVVIAVIIVMGGSYILYKRSFQPDAGNPNEEIALTNIDSSSPRTPQNTVSWPESLRLKYIEKSLSFDIANQISGTSTVIKAWDVIGERLGLDQDQLQVVDVAGQKQNTNHGTVLLIKLAAEYPELTLSKFVEVLEDLGRRDVVDSIKSHYNNKNKVNTVVEMTQNFEDYDHV